MCDSLLSLIISHRRFYSDYPLLPWLHSTESCEHVFGVLRKIKKDFTALDFLHFIPKLRVMLLGEFGNLSLQEQANATASGYHHTYFQSDDIDLQALMIWPTDDELKSASLIAYDEAIQLLSFLGITTLPPAIVLEHVTIPPTESEDPILETERHTLEDLLHGVHISNDISLTHAEEREIIGFTFALAASQIDESHIMWVCKFLYSEFVIVDRYNYCSENLPDSTDLSITEVHDVLHESIISARMQASNSSLVC